MFPSALPPPCPDPVSQHMYRVSKKRSGRPAQEALGRGIARPRKGANSPGSAAGRLAYKSRQAERRLDMTIHTFIPPLVHQWAIAVGGTRIMPNPVKVTPRAPFVKHLPEVSIFQETRPSNGSSACQWRPFTLRRQIETSRVQSPGRRTRRASSRMLPGPLPGRIAGSR